MALTAEETATYTTYLAEAKAALHSHTIGGAARTYVDQNGERVEFAVANAGRLRAYIMELQTKLGLPTGVVGPLKPWVL